MSEYTLFVKRIGLVGIAQTIFGLKGLIILPILTKTLNVDDYGTLTQILITISLFQPFVQLGLDSSLLRFLSSKEKKEIIQGIITVLCITLFAGTIASLAIYSLSSQFAAILLRDESAAYAIKVASSLVVLEALNSMALGTFRIFGQIKRYSAMLILQAILEVGLIAFFVSSGAGLIGVAISLVIIKSITLAVKLFLIVSHAGFARPDFSILYPYLKYGLPLIPTLIFEFVISSSDRYVIGFFNGASAVGVYSAAYNIGTIILMITSYIIYILRPEIYKKYDEGKLDAVRTYLSNSLKYLLMLLIPSIFGLSILSEPLLTNLTTPEFIPIGKFIIPLVALGMTFSSVELIFGTVIMLSRSTRIFTIVFGAAAVANLALNLLLVSHWGAIGAAISSTIAYAIAAGFIYYESLKYVKFDIDLNFIIKTFLSSIAMTFAIWMFNPADAIEIIISIILGALVYFIILNLLKGFNKAELSFIYYYLKIALHLK